ncbi:MAG TPA: molybdate ABC transporter substrate-binding protein [Candidatus Agathobaculum merdigallinarum]|nr:molybdate ABC transporter substrate-binding protein [Candidatus Agathobaculum merdigallinarum]
MNKIKQGLAFGLAGVMMSGMLGGCSSTGESSEATASDTQEEAVELTVFAAASLTEALTEIAEQYKEVAPEVSLVFNFDSSGTLKTQIEEGAECDIFISAAQKQMNELDATQDAEKNPDGLDYIDPETRIDLLENKVVLVVPEGNPAGINAFEEIGEKSNLIALGNDDVPVGQYSEEILQGLGLLEQLESENKITYGSNVKEVTTQVAEGSVDCGIVYATDANSAGLTIVAQASEDMCSQVIYPAALLKNSKYPEQAQAFLDYLQDDAAMQVFEEIGFSPAAAQ